MLFVVDDLWQGYFHSEFVLYTQKFILQNFIIKVVYVYDSKFYDLAQSLVLYVTSLLHTLPLYYFFKVV